MTSFDARLEEFAEMIFGGCTAPVTVGRFVASMNLVEVKGCHYKAVPRAFTGPDGKKTVLVEWEKVRE